MRSLSVLLRLLTAAALAVDAYVHLHLASNYDAVKATVSQGLLFRVEAAAAIVAALLVLTGARLAWVLAFLVAAAGLAAVLVYRYRDVGDLGPIPDMYEPIWFPEKTLSAFAEGAAVLVTVAGILLGAGRRSAAEVSTAA